MAVAAPAFAMPTTVTFVDLATCDPLAVPPEVDELGIGFPADELISADDTTVSLSACPSADVPGVANTMVRMSNLTGRSFAEVWYVAEPETSLSNVDGTINGELAFRIDSVGLNTPLFSESIALNDIFEPGELWEFIIDDYANTLGLAASALVSIGVPSGGGVSSGSIIGVVPEPSTALLLGVGLAGLALLRRRQART
jgi:hypothetical protein